MLICSSWSNFLLIRCDCPHSNFLHIVSQYTQEKRERLVSFEHRFRMCQLAFAPLNIENVLSTPPHQQTKIIISDAEYMSWNNAVKDRYVLHQ